MGKQDVKKEVKVVAIKAKMTGPSRHKRNSFQRKCLTKASKRMFAAMPSSVRAAMLAFERENKSRITG